ncbi:MAG: MBL fold metallo-hydrolase [Simkaniaceae bacterium]|nr:MBL fold metallo-hydrolase [Simkaniaceae bacterium]
MRIEVLPCGAFEENALFIDDGHGGVIIVDPGEGSAAVFLERLRRGGQKALAICLTHSHWDHIVDVAKLKLELKVPVFIHAADEANLIQPGSDGLPLAFPIEGIHPDAHFEDNQTVQLGALTFKVLHTPGHSPGGCIFYFEKEKVIIGGDLIFHGGIGNTALPTAEPEKMRASLERAVSLPEETKIYPGHGPTTTVKEAKQMIGEMK